nr:MAG TPA: hypothetical protein [Caudoviricetes sp.]
MIVKKPGSHVMNMDRMIIENFVMGFMNFRMK